MPGVCVLSERRGRTRGNKNQRTNNIQLAATLKHKSDEKPDSLLGKSISLLLFHDIGGLHIRHRQCFMLHKSTLRTFVFILAWDVANCVSRLHKRNRNPNHVLTLDNISRSITVIHRCSFLAPTPQSADVCEDKKDRLYSLLLSSRSMAISDSCLMLWNRYGTDLKHTGHSMWTPLRTNWTTYGYDAIVACENE